MVQDYWSQFEEVNAPSQNSDNNDYWLQFDEVQQPIPQPKNVVQNRPANQELQVEQKQPLEGQVTKNVIKSDVGNYDDLTSNPNWNNLSKEEKIRLINEKAENERKKIDNDNLKTMAKLYGGAALEIGSAAIPGTAGVKIASKVAPKLVPYLGRKLAQELTTGAISGGLSGIPFGIGRGLMEDKNIAETALTDTALGTVLGGAGSLGAAKIAQKINANNLSKMPTAGRANKKALSKKGTEYYKDYIQGTSVTRNDLGKIDFDNVGVRETRNQKVQNLKNYPDLKKNIKDAEYLGAEEPVHEHEYISKFHRLRNNGEDYLIAESKNGKKYYISKDAQISSTPRTTAEAEETLSATNNSITNSVQKVNPSQEANNIINTQRENLVKELGVDNINEIAKPEYSKEMRDEAINIVAAATGKKPEYIQMVAKSSTGNKGVATKNSKLQELMEGGSENIVDSGLGNDLKFYDKKGLTYDDAEIEGGYDIINKAFSDLANDNFYVNKELSQYDNMLNSADNKIKETFKNLIDDPENFANNVTKYSDEVTEYLEKNVPEQDRGQFYDAFYNGLDKINQYTDNVNGLKAGTKKVRSFGSSKYGKEISEGTTDKVYDVNTHETQANNWMSKTAEEQQLLLNDVDNIAPEVMYGKAEATKQAIANGEPVSKSMLNGVARNLTKAGQEVEAAKHFMPTTPEGIALEVTKLGRETAPKGALKVIDNADKIAEQLKSVNVIGDVEKILKKNGISTSKIGRNRGLADDLLNIVKNNQLGIENLNGDRLIDLIQKRYKIANFGVDDYAKAEELTNKFANATTQREKDIALGYIKKFILSKEENGKVGNRLKAWRFANMLGSVPSRSADLLSTATYQGVRAVDEAIAKTISKAFNTGTRSGYSSLNPVKWAKNVWENAKIGAEDTELGINTLRMGDKDGYHLGSLPQFEGTPLEGWEKLVRHSVNDPDRAFHGGRYQSSYDDLMATGNFTEEEAKEIAAKEALDNVFQGNGVAARSMTTARNWADKALGPLQVGSHLMPFVKTPTNLIVDAVNRGLPIDLARGIYKFNKATSLAEKREAEDLIAKGITGQAITWGGGYGLNKLANNIGQINASDTFGDDVTGLAPQSVVIGNKGYSLSNVPYLSIPMAIGKELTNTEKDIPDRITSALANAFSAGMSLPAIKTFGDLTKTGNDLVNAISSGDTDKMGKQIATSLSPIASNIISSYFPFSGIEGNIRTALDPYNREVRSDDFATSVLSRVYNRIPASNKLPMKYNVEGNPSMRINIENPVGRWAEALLSPVKIRNYNPPSELKQELDTIQDLMKDSDIQGKTQISYKQMPRSVKVNGKSIRLEGEQYGEAQRLYGKLQTKYKQEILNNKSWTDEQKAKKLAEVSTNANEAIRIELLGHKPKNKKGKYTNRMIDDIKNGDL